MLAKGLQLTTTPVTSNSKRRRKVKDNDGSLQATRVTERKEKIVTASPVRLCLNQQQKEFKEIAATAEQQQE
jgi:hypothetical protein